jgi:hypothetical protein
MTPFLFPLFSYSTYVFIQVFMTGYIGPSPTPLLRAARSQDIIIYHRL